MASPALTVAPFGHRLARISVIPFWLAGYASYVHFKEPSLAYEFYAASALILVLGVVALAGARWWKRRSVADTDRYQPKPIGWPSSAATLGLAVLAYAVIPDLRVAAALVIPVYALTALATLLKRPAFADALRPAAIVGATGVFALAAVHAIEPYLQYVRFPTFVAAAIGRGLGFTAYEDGSALAFERFGQVVALGTGPRHAELAPTLLALALGGAILVQNTFGLRRRVARLSVWLALVEVYRQTLIAAKLCVIASDSYAAQHPATAIIPWTLAFLPLLLVATLGHRLQAAPTPVAEPTPRWRRRLALGGCTAAALLIALALTWSPPGIRKGGRIAVDAHHSQWEWTDVPLNRTLFGTKTTYNFWSVMVYLRQFFPTVDAIDEGPLTDESLARYDIWILKTPTNPYSRSEVEALHRFVRRGGGLWLVGDHTNIFGMNAFLNQVSSPLGITFQPDATFDLGDEAHHQLWVGPKHRAHPVVAEVDEFLFATSDTLVIDPTVATPLMVGGPYYADIADYTKLTFFGDHQWSPREPAGNFIQCASATAGAGRVVAFGDSTVYSSFYALTLGKPELALGTMNWLNHRNRWPNWPMLPVGAGLGLLLASVALGLSRWPRVSEGALVRAALAGAVIGLGLADLAARQVREALPIADWKLPRIAALCGENTALRLRKPDGHDETNPHGFQNWYVGLQRADTLPTTVRSVDRLLEESFAVLVEPTLDQARDLAPRLAGHFEKGGRLWLLSSDPEIVGLLHRASGFDGDGTEKLEVAARTWPVAPTSGAPTNGCEHGHCGGSDPCHEGVLLRPATFVDPPTIPESSEVPAYVLAACAASGCQTDGSCVHQAPLPVTAWNHVSNSMLDVVPPRLGLIEFEPLLSVSASRACFHGRRRSGAGEFIVTTNPEVFSDKELGSTTDIPTRERYRIFEALWQTIDAAVGRPVATQSLVARAETDGLPAPR